MDPTEGRGTAVDVLARMQDPESMDDPYPLYAWLREHAPVHRNPTGGVYFVSRHRDARLVMRDPAFRSATREELLARQPRIGRSRTLQNFLAGITNTNRPRHTRLRRAMAPFFTPQAVDALRLRARRWCDRLLDPLVTRLRDGESVDLHTAATAPLATHVIAEVIGVPEEDRPFLGPLVAKTMLAAHPAADDAALAEADGATLAIERYFTELAAERRRRPRADAVSALAGGPRGTGPGAGEEPLEEAELINMLWGLWMAGSESTAAAMDNAALALFRHPETAPSLGDPALLPGFVEESLRHEPPIWIAASQLLPVRDVEVAGTLIPRGAGVHVLIGSVNRDPEAFPDPDRFDPGRGAPGYLTFGEGIHRCVGAGLARMEIATFLSRLQGHLHARLPHLTPAGPPVRRRMATQRSFDSLPVALVRPPRP
ncbi:cytochrome P450 [Streptomyces sp. SBT349]|uniref:cytochrome P450 n=1 Tax=Streptomyces sp. SBT349 TaxID=1580539 RepID=UPI00066C3A8B|nr:cytochrome P450 [Streptomyces sp. SBT349]